LNVKRKSKSLASLLIVCCFSCHILAAMPLDAALSESQSAAAAPDPEIKEKRISRFLKDEGEMWAAPFNLDLKGSLVFASVLVGTGILIANDEAIYSHVKQYQRGHAWVDQVSPKITLLGDWGIDCGIAGLFILGGAALKDKKARETGWMALETLMHTGLLAQVIKHLAGRQRPLVEHGQDYWFGPAAFFKRYSEGYFARYDSFASGHTISAWGLATVIAESYKDRLWVPLTCYGLATAVGLSRLTEDAHWLSDVFAGAVLGYVIGRMVVRNRDRSLQIAPAVAPNGVGLAVSYRIE
jgi:membrane-associated phospholipid phosphatase